MHCKQHKLSRRARFALRANVVINIVYIKKKNKTSSSRSTSSLVYSTLIPLTLSSAINFVLYLNEIIPYRSCTSRLDTVNFGVP